MHQANLTSYYQDEDCTLSVFSIVGKKDPIFYSIERPWQGNEPFTSCIPAGRYDVVPFKSPKHGKVYEVKNVLARTFIEFHIANRVSELLGCIALGTSAGYMIEPMNGKLVKAVTSSGQALHQMKQEFNYEPFELNVLR